MSAMFRRKYVYDPETGEWEQYLNIMKGIDPQHFMKAQMVDLLMSLDIIGGKSMQVYSYVLNHMNYRTNKLHQTNDQILHGMKKEHHKVSKRTIMRVLNTLENTKDSKGKPLITRKRYGRYGKHSYLMLDPDILHYGKPNQYNGLLIQYKKTGAKRTNHHKSNNNNNVEKLNKKVNQTSLFSKHQDYSAHESKLRFPKKNGKNKRASN